MAFPRNPAWQDGVDNLGAGTFNDIETRASAAIAAGDQSNAQAITAESTRAQAAEIAPWTPGSVYLPTQQVVHNNQGYACTTAHTATSTFDPTKWALLGAGGVGGSGDTHTVTPLGVQGSTSAVTLVEAVAQWVTMTLTADHVCTITPISGGTVKFYLTQDATGGHTFSISDGVSTELLSVATAAGGMSVVTVSSPDGTDLWVE